MRREKNACNTGAGTRTFMTEDNNRYFFLSEKGRGAYNFSIWHSLLM
jgi:hypothetical protein